MTSYEVFGAVCWIPLAFAFVAIVGDTMHVIFHIMDSCSSKFPVFGWLSYIHTAHHRFVDAYGQVDNQHFAANILLDNFAKCFVKLWLAWRAWSMLTICKKARSSTAATRRAMAAVTVFDLARALDVMSDSGLDVTKEPAAEVMLRAIAASWFADRYPKESEVAEWLKESSMGNFGIPRGMLEEARAMRKLTQKATKGEGD